MRSYGEVIDVRTASGPRPSPLSPSGSSGSSGSSMSSGSSGSSGSSVSGSPAPSQFLWRGRVYVVREVLAHWVELGTWWTTRALQPAPPRPRRVLGHPLAPTDGPVPSISAGSAISADGAAADSAAADRSRSLRSVAADVGAVEREVWRVEAVAGRSATPGVYDLVHDVRARDVDPHDPDAPHIPGTPPGPARWRLARALD